MLAYLMKLFHVKGCDRVDIVIKEKDLTKEKSYTTADIYAMPDGRRAELIDGQIYAMSPPGFTHQKISRELFFSIVNYVKKNGGDCEVLAAPFAVSLNNDDKNYLEPDISVICDPSKLDEQGCHGAPDWIIEIVSPSSRSRDYIKKMIKYNMAGVREYWIADHEKNRIIVYNFERNTMEEYSFGDNVPVGIYDDFFIKIQ